MSVIGSNVLAGASGQAAGYEIERSLRFNDDDSAYLSKTFASAGNRRTWTFSVWVKRCELGTTDDLFNSGGNSSQPRSEFRFKADDTITIGFNPTGSAWYNCTTSAVFRDPSAWYHIVVACDTTQSTSTDRLKLYVNGVLQTFGSSSFVSQNTELPVNDSTYPHSIGRYQSGDSAYFDGLMADVHFIDGQALDPTDFGEYDDNNVWQPIEYAGTYGTNGFHLDFSDNSSNAALGYDAAGSNDWTVNNISVDAGNYAKYPGAITSSDGEFYNSSNPANFFSSGTDFFGGYNAGTGNSSFLWTPPGGVSVSNPKVTVGYFTAVKINGTSYATSDGSSASSEQTLSFTGTLNTLTVENTTGNGFVVRAYGFKPDGTNLVTLNSGAANDSLVDSPTNGTQTDTGAGGEVVGNYATLNPLHLYNSPTLSNGNLETTNSTTNHWKNVQGTIGVSSGKWYWESTMSGGSQYYTLGVAIASEISNTYGGSGDAWVYDGRGFKNGPGVAQVSYGATYTSGDTIGVALDLDAGTLVFYKNGTSQGTAFNTGLTGKTVFPQFGVYYTSAVTQIANFGQRPFAYTAPSGFKALCTTNLTDPTIADGSTAMDAKLYTGNASTQAVTGLNFQPDLVWLKRRDSVGNHNIQDVVRGASAVLQSDYSGAEFSNAARLASFDSNGFTLTSDNGGNTSGGTYVAWTWDAGTSTVSNTDGSITSSVRANASAGFSIVSYTGTGANATIGHGGLTNLSNGMIIIKNRDKDPTNWRVYHSALGNTKMIYLSYNGTPDTSSVYWNNTSPTSTVFSVGSDDGVNENGDAIIAYCFAPVEGYSAFGSYTGNGSADGPFVYTGFRPAYILIKKSSAASSVGWFIYDYKTSAYNFTPEALLANSSAATQNLNAGTGGAIDILSNGFKLRGSYTDVNASGATMIYAAFAEHPLKHARAR